MDKDFDEDHTNEQADQAKARPAVDRNHLQQESLSLLASFTAPHESTGYAPPVQFQYPSCDVPSGDLELVSTCEDAQDAQRPRKLFVGGLGWDTHQQPLHDYFSHFGEVARAQVMYNRDTGVPRGFGFVTFVDEGGAQKAASQRHHRINHKTVEVKFAVKRGDDRLVSEAFVDKLARQVFVGGLPRDATPDELKEWAQKLFGKENVVSAILVLDLPTRKPRGFGFVSFKSPEMVNTSLSMVPADCEFRADGHQVQVKRAKPRREKCSSGGKGDHRRGHTPRCLEMHAPHPLPSYYPSVQVGYAPQAQLGLDGRWQPELQYAPVPYGHHL